MMSHPTQRITLEHARPPAPVLGTELPGPIQTAEAGELPAFTELMHEQLALLDRGDIGLPAFPRFMEIANQVTFHDEREYTGPDGEVFAGDDAEAARRLYGARTPDAWILSSGSGEAEPSAQPGEGGASAEHAPSNKLTAEELKVAAKVFNLFGGMEEADIPEEKRAELEIGRRRVALTLGVTDPSAFTLRELEDRIRAREELSAAVTERRLDEHFLPRVLRSSSLGQQPTPEDDATADLAAVPGLGGGDDATTQVLSMPPPPSLNTDGRHRHAGDEVATSGLNTQGKHQHPSEVLPPPSGTEKPPVRSHRLDPTKDTERVATRRMLARVAVSTAITTTVGTLLRVADVVPGGAIVTGTVIGALGMVVGTLANRELWGQLEGGKQKLRALGKAALIGGMVGAGVAAGTTLLIDAVSSGLDALHGASFDNSSHATLHQIQDSSSIPDPPPTPQPPVPHLPDTPWQTNSLGNFTGADGADNNPFLEGTGYDVVADKLDAQVLAATGHPLDWSAVDQRAYHDFVGQVLQQNGRSWGDMLTAPDATRLAIDPRQAIAFLNSQLPNAHLGLGV